MFALVPVVANIAALAASPPAVPARLCGNGGLTRGNASMILYFLDAPANLHSPHVGVTALNEDGSYRVSVGYRPTQLGLGRPQIVHVEARIALAGEAEARSLRLEWRAPGEAWTAPRRWSEPQRFFPSEEPRFRVNYRLGQGEPYPHGTEVLDTLANGVRYEFRNVDEEGRIVSTGAAVYPPQSVIEDMYAAAKAEALGRLRPCAADAPPVRVSPSPPASNK